MGHKGYEIYVDGSFINGAIGYGAVILSGGNVVGELYGAVDDRSVASARQVAGELFAVREALRWCKENSVAEVALFYDYYGIEKWATGRWKANQPLTISYREFVQNSGVRIRWHKVESHTGDRWNDRADALAKKGAAAAAPSETAEETANGRAELLSRATDEFIDVLMVNGVEAAFDKIYNGQFARLSIIEDEKRVGIFDLYDTDRKPLSAYLHGFKDEELKGRVESLWKELRQKLRGQSAD